MRLSALLAGLEATLPVGAADPAVLAVEHDSRKVKAGSLFVCLPGLKVDGHAFAAGAARAGAVAIVAEREVSGVEGAVVVRVPSSRRALASCALALAGRPDRALVLAGVTGTNGKTTTAFLYEAIALAAGGRPGMIGTVSYRFAGRARPAEHTTPEATELAALFTEMKALGCDGAVLEVRVEDGGAPREVGDQSDPASKLPVHRQVRVDPRRVRARAVLAVGRVDHVLHTETYLQARRRPPPGQNVDCEPPRRTVRVDATVVFVVRAQLVLAAGEADVGLEP